MVSGDDYDDPPEGVAVEVVPIRREFALSDFAVVRRGCGATSADSGSTSCRPTPPRRRSSDCPRPGWPAAPAVYTIHGALYFAGQRPDGQHPGLVLRTVVLHVGQPGPGPEPRGRVGPPGGRGSAAGGKLAYVGNGIVVDRFSNRWRPPCSSDRPIVMMVSRLVREKGCADFLGLAASLSGRADFVHVGPFEHDQSDALTEAEMAAAPRPAR